MLPIDQLFFMIDGGDRFSFESEAGSTVYLGKFLNSSVLPYHLQKKGARWKGLVVDPYLLSLSFLLRLDFYLGSDMTS